MKINTTVKPHLIQVMPELGPLLGCQVELSVRIIKDNSTEVRFVSFEELLHNRLKKSDHIKSVTLEDMEQAIASGATDAGR